MCFVFVLLFYMMSPFSEKDNLGLISNFFIEQKYFHNKLQKADTFYPAFLIPLISILQNLQTVRFCNKIDLSSPIFLILVF